MALFFKCEASPVAVSVILIFFDAPEGPDCLYAHSGMEGVGVVTAVGPGLTGRKVGDRVAYAGKFLKYLLFFYT